MYREWLVNLTVADGSIVVVVMLVFVVWALIERMR